MVKFLYLYQQAKDYMTYYILMDGESKDNLIYDANILGESSFKTFYTDRGFDRLIKLVTDYPELIEKTQIFDDHNKHYTVHQFLNIMEKHTIAKQ